MKPQLIYLLSGNGNMAAWWKFTLPYFTSFTPIPLELPGFGNNRSSPCSSLDSLTSALLDATKPGHTIVACGVNCLPVLHAAVKQPDHFKKIILYSPIGAFLWQRRLPKMLAYTPMQFIVRFLLSYFPKLFKSTFTTKTWSKENYDLLAEGYRRCRSFGRYFNWVKPHNALTLFDTIEAKIDIVWGLQDKIAKPQHAAAWESILPRARLRFSFQDQWGHYPYFEQPADFVSLLDHDERRFYAHTKAGRLKLAKTAGLPVPVFSVVNAVTLDSVSELVAARPNSVWAVRSSHVDEDQFERSNAGLTKTYLRVPTNQVIAKTRELLNTSNEVIVQEFIQPKVSGVAFVRRLSAEIEWVEGHLNPLVQGRVTPQRAVLAKLGGQWQQLEDRIQTYGMNLYACNRFLQSVVRSFHYAHLDIEWAWDGKQFYLLQLRPVTTYAWRRHLTAANIGEILPKNPSRLMEWAQRRASNSIPHIYALWDSGVLEDNEPFTGIYKNASYLNSDLFLSRLFDWGLPSAFYTRLIGGCAPTVKANTARFLLSIPVFIKMINISRIYIRGIDNQLHEFENDLYCILKQPSNLQRNALANWFLRFYVFVVQTNIVLNAAIATSLGNWSKHSTSAYKTLALKESYHRVKFETDPASPRPNGPIDTIPSHPHSHRLGRALDYLCLPGNANQYIEAREWFRDCYTRLYYTLHHGLRKFEKTDYYWFEHHPAPRGLTGSFWQSNGGIIDNKGNSVIFPGCVEGIVGKDILVVDTLDPGQFRFYRTFKAVITRMGGQLSHGAILLREFKIPSAIMPDLPPIEDGTTIRINHGSFSIYS